MTTLAWPLVVLVLGGGALWLVHRYFLSQSRADELEALLEQAVDAAERAHSRLSLLDADIGNVRSDLAKMKREREQESLTRLNGRRQ
jgi:hypothetical protein